MTFWLEVYRPLFYIQRTAESNGMFLRRPFSYTFKHDFSNVTCSRLEFDVGTKGTCYVIEVCNETSVSLPKLHCHSY